MKNVLLIDASPLFREFLKDKLSAEKVSVTVTQGKRDAFIKMISILPDLIIYEIQDDFSELLRFLEKKRADPNAVRIPMIVSGPVADRTKLSQFAQFGVTKYFTKPIKFDIFFEAVGQILSLAFSMDTTQCVLDIHRNGDIIFIEIADGLNREKLALLKYKLTEMIEAGKTETPKIILMMTNLDLSFVDGSNIELLLDNVLADPKVLPKNVKVLSLNSFIRELIAGHPQYDGIEVVTELSHRLGCRTGRQRNRRKRFAHRARGRRRCRFEAFGKRVQSRKRDLRSVFQRSGVFNGHQQTPLRFRRRRHTDARYFGFRYFGAIGQHRTRRSDHHLFADDKARRRHTRAQPRRKALSSKTAKTRSHRTKGDRAAPWKNLISIPTSD